METGSSSLELASDESRELHAWLKARGVAPAQLTNYDKALRAIREGPTSPDL